MIDRHSSSASPPINPSWCLAGIVVLFIAYSLAFFWYLADDVPELLGPVCAGAWIMQAHMFATCAALGPGKFLLRVPPVVAVFLAVLGVPGIHREGTLECGEFIAMALVGAAIFTVTTLLLVVLRRFVGWRIEFIRDASHSDDSRYQFSIWYLIVLTTLYAAALGIYFNIVFETPEPPPWGIFGPDFVIAIIVYGGATMAVLLWPIIAVPLFALSTRRSKRGSIVALTFWAVITAGVTTFWHVMDDKGVSGILLWAILLQVGAAMMGLFAALPLRLLGCRLVRRKVRAPVDRILSEDD